jgi:ribosomal protein L37AE/L43A
MQLSTYELKYCELCGSLRMRRATSAETYCQPCGQMLANYSVSHYAQRANLRLCKAPAKSGAAPVVPGDTHSGLPSGRLQ